MHAYREEMGDFVYHVSLKQSTIQSLPKKVCNSEPDKSKNPTKTQS